MPVFGIESLLLLLGKSAVIPAPSGRTPFTYVRITKWLPGSWQWFQGKLSFDIDPVNTFLSSTCV